MVCCINVIALKKTFPVVINMPIVVIIIIIMAMIIDYPIKGNYFSRFFFWLVRLVESL